MILLLLLGVVVLGGGGFALYYYTSSRSPKPAPQGAPSAVGGVGRWGAAVGRARGALWQRENDDEYDDDEYYDDEDEYEDDWEDGEDWEEDDPYYDQRGGWNGGAQTGRSNVTGPGWNGVTGAGPAGPGGTRGSMSRPSGWTGQGPTQSRPTWDKPGGGASGPLPPPPRRPTR